MSGTKGNSGGKRKGAGRPKTGKCRIVLWVMPRTARQLKKLGGAKLDHFVELGIL